MSYNDRREAFIANRVSTDPTFEKVTQLQIPQNLSFDKLGAWEGMRAREPFTVPTILASSRDTGETKVVSKAMDEFHRRGWKTEFMAVGDGLPLLEQSGYSSRWGGEPRVLIDMRRGHAVVTGFSEQDNLAAAMHLTSHKIGVGHYRIEDFDGAIGKNMQNYYGVDFGLFVPEKVFVANEWAAEQNRPYFHEDKIIVTGSPSIPALDPEQQQKTRKDLRRKLNIRSDATVAAWFGQVGEVTVKALEIYVDALNEVGGAEDLLVRFHPKFIRTGDVGIALPILDKFKGRVHHVSGIDIPEVKNEKVGDVNDVIDTMDFGGNEASTVAKEAAARRRMMFSIDIEERDFAVAAIDRGASPVIRRAGEAAGVIRQARYNRDVRTAYLERMKEFESNGLGAFNIVNAVEADIFTGRQDMLPLK